MRDPTGAPVAGAAAKKLIGSWRTIPRAPLLLLFSRTLQSQRSALGGVRCVSLQVETRRRTGAPPWQDCVLVVQSTTAPMVLLQHEGPGPCSLLCVLSDGKSVGPLSVAGRAARGLRAPRMRGGSQAAVSLGAMNRTACSTTLCSSLPPPSRRASAMPRARRCRSSTRRATPRSSRRTSAWTRR
jgi:hypothetical protein